MKKLAQLVALLLTLTVSAQPAFADDACAHTTCGNPATMACCPPASNAMPARMNCARPHPPAADPMRCTSNSCCMLSPATAPAITIFVSSTPVAASVRTLTATSWQPTTLTPLKGSPRIRPILPTARYILFRDFRI